MAKQAPVISFKPLTEQELEFLASNWGRKCGRTLRYRAAIEIKKLRGELAKLKKGIK